MNETFKSERAAEPVGAFPHAKRVGEFCFCQGSDHVFVEAKKFPV